MKLKMFQSRIRGTRRVFSFSGTGPIRKAAKLTIKKPFPKFAKLRPAPPTPIPASVTPPTPVSASSRRVLDAQHHDPSKQIPLKPLITKIVSLAQILAEKKFYDYQIELTFRLVESLLLHDGDVITSLMARQMGKSECIGAIAAAIAIILPDLAKKFPDDWKLNITDEKGVYRGYAQGIKIGIYAPKQEQAEILFERVKKALLSDAAKRVLAELKITFDVKNGNKVKLSNGGHILCETASENSKIEGATHHLLILEECQDISDIKIRKSLHPMVAATAGTIVKIGTATTRKCDFYTAIRHNERMYLVNGRRNHFFYPYTVGIRYNSMYRKTIEKEKILLGEESDEFQTSYCGKWIFERGMFITQELLFNINVAMTAGAFSMLYQKLPREMRHYSIVVGIDWGSSHDSTVLTFIAVDWNNPTDSGIDYTDENGRTSYTYYKKHVIGWMEFQGDDYEHQYWEIVGVLNNISNLRKIVTDSNTCGKPIFDRLSKYFRGRPVAVEPFNFQARVKSDGYKSLYHDICGKRVTFPAGEICRKSKHFQKFVNQMLDLRKEYKNNLMAVAHPDEKGAHDDYPDSLMLANWGANSPSVGNRIDFSSSNPFI